jgi:cell wall-associated NlpC family hydrolase
MRAFFAPLLGAVVLAAIGTSPAGAAPGVPTAPTNAQIQAARAKAVALSQLISTENEKEQIASEHYDQANILIGRAQKRLATLHTEIHRESLAIAAGKRKVQRAAVEAYVDGDSASTQLAGLLTSSLADAGSLTTYAGVATTALHAAVVRLDRAEARLFATEVEVRAQAAAARAAAASSATARSQALSARQTASVTLSQVKGQLAALIEQQALINAAREAAAAQAATASAARNEDALNAQAEAELANALAGNDPQAAQAAEAEAAIASEAGQPPLVAAGSTPAGDTAVRTAESFLGVPYVWGGSGPDGFDCSGLTMVAWAAAGVNLTHSAWYQYQETTHIPLTDIEPGDLLFYTFPNDGPNPITHVAMYVGSGPYGSETIIQAPETGETVSYSPMYYFGFVGAGRP